MTDPAPPPPTRAEYEAAVREVDRILDYVVEAPGDTERLMALSKLIQRWEDWLAEHGTQENR